MNTSRIFLFILTALVAILVLTGIVRLAARAFRRITEVPYKESPAFAAWFAGTMAMLGLAFIPAMSTILEASELIYGTTTGNTPAGVRNAFTAALQTSAMVILVAAAWFWIWQLVAGYLIIPVAGKANPENEMELGNTTYFIIKYLLALLCMMVMLPFYQSLLSYFIPQITTPFYR